MVAYCPECGGETTADDKFCPHCGADLTREGAGGASAGEQDEWGQQGADAGRGQPTGGYDQGRNQADDQWDSGGQQGADAGHGQPAGGYDQGRNQAGDQWDSGGQQTTGRYGISRKDAMETVQLTAGWLFSLTTFLGVLVALEFVNSLGTFIPGLAILLFLVGLVLRPLLGGVGALYADHMVRLGERQDPTLEFGDAFNQALSKAVTLIIIQVVYVIAVAIGLVLLIVPGIYIGARLSLSIPACMLDDQGVSESLSTSWDVAEGNLWKLVGIFFLLAIPAVAVGLIPEPAIGVIASPVFGILNGIFYLAAGRIYLENVTGSDVAGQNVAGSNEHATQTRR